MGKFLTAAGVWFEGKKTILGGVIVMAAAAAGVWYQKVDPVTGLTILGAGLSILGAAAKANRHQAELLTALQGVAAVGADFGSGNKAKAVQDALATAKALEPGVIAAAVPAATSALHIFGATADDVLKIAQAIRTPTVMHMNAVPAIPVGFESVGGFIDTSAQIGVAAK